MTVLEDGRRCWSEEEVEFLSNPKNLKTEEDRRAAQEYFAAMELNRLIDCLIDDIDPVTGRPISEEEEEAVMDVVRQMRGGCMKLEAFDEGYCDRGAG